MPGLLSALVALENQYGSPAPTSATPPAPKSGAPPAPPAATAPVADWTQYYQTNPSLETAATNQTVWNAELQNQNWLQSASANQDQGYDSAVGLSAPTAADYTSYDTYEKHVAAVNAQNAAGQAAYQQQLAAYDAQQAAAAAYHPTTANPYVNGAGSNPYVNSGGGTVAPAVGGAPPNPYVNLGYGSVPEAVAVPAVGAYGPTAGSEYNLTPTQVGGQTATAKGSSGNTLFGSGPVTAIAAGLPLDQSQLLSQADQLQAYIAAVESNGTGWHAGPNGMPVPNGQGGYDPGIFGGTGSGLISDSGTGMYGEFAGGTPSGGPVGAINRADAAPGASFGQGGGGGFGGGAPGISIPGSSNEFGGPPPDEAPGASVDTGQGFATDALPSTPPFWPWLASQFPNNGDAGQPTFGGGPPSSDTSPQATFGGSDASGVGSAISNWFGSAPDAAAQGQATFGGGVPEAPAGDAAFSGPPQLSPGATNITPEVLAQPDAQLPASIADIASALPAPEVTPAQQTINLGAGFGGGAAPSEGPADNFGLPPPEPQTASEKFVQDFGPTSTLRAVMTAAATNGVLPDGTTLESAFGNLGAGVDTPIDLTNPKIADQVYAAINGPSGSGFVAGIATPKLMEALTSHGQTPQKIADAAQDVVQDKAENSDAAYGLPRQTFDTIQAEQTGPSFWSQLTAPNITAPAGSSGEFSGPPTPQFEVPNQDIVGQPIYTDEPPKFPDSGQDIAGRSFGPDAVAQTGVPPEFASLMGLNASNITPTAGLPPVGITEPSTPPAEPIPGIPATGQNAGLPETGQPTFADFLSATPAQEAVATSAGGVPGNIDSQYGMTGPTAGAGGGPQGGVVKDVLESGSEPSSPEQTALAALRSPYLQQLIDDPSLLSNILGFPTREISSKATPTQEEYFYNSALNRGVGRGANAGSGNDPDSLVSGGPDIMSIFSDPVSALTRPGTGFFPTGIGPGNPSVAAQPYPGTNISSAYYPGVTQQGINAAFNPDTPAAFMNSLQALTASLYGSPLGGLINNNGANAAAINAIQGLGMVPQRAAGENYVADRAQGYNQLLAAYLAALPAGAPQVPPPTPNSRR